MKCKICHKVIHGRSDKQFCSLKCKNYYHVKLRRVTHYAAKDIDRILHRNRSILLEILGKNAIQKKIDRTILAKKHFNFKYFTHLNTNKQGKVYHYVYDLAWMEFSDDEILVVRKRS